MEKAEIMGRRRLKKEVVVTTAQEAAVS